MGDVRTAASRIFIISSHNIDVIIAIEQFECVADLRTKHKLNSLANRSASKRLRLQN